MKRILCIARREYLATVATKGFLIGLLVVPLLMFGSLLVLVLAKDHRDTTDRRVAVVDHSGRFAPLIVEAAELRNRTAIQNKAGEKTAPAYVIEVLPSSPEDLAAQRLALSERVRRGELKGFVEIHPWIVEGSQEGSGVNYHSPSAALDDLRTWLAEVINRELRRWRLQNAGISESQVPRLFEWVNVEPMGLLSADESTGEVRPAEAMEVGRVVIGPMVLSIVMYMMLLMAGLPMLSAVMEEKTQRIAEVLLSSARPFDLMTGKVLSATAVALTGAGVYVTLGVAMGLHLAAITWIPWKLLLWFVLYLVPAIVTHAALSACLGSACSDQKDAQSLTLPALLPIMIPMFFLGVVLKEPQSTLATALSFFPPFTPTLMLIRLGLPGGAPAWQGWVAFVGLVLFAVAILWVAGRIFRVALLIQGQSPKLKDLVRWAIQA